MTRIVYRAHRRRSKYIQKGNAIMNELTRTLETVVKPELLKRFRLITANWKIDVDFAARKTIRPAGIGVYVFPTGTDKKIWHYVSKGTRPHRIRARNVPYLAYMWGGKGSYKAKTAPGGKFGGPGVVQNATLRRPVEVNHPGNKAREFEKHIMEFLF